MTAVRRRSIISGLLLAALVGAVLFAAMASAQEPPVFTVMLSAAELNQPGTSGQTIGQELGSLTIFANDDVCATVNVSGPSSDVPVYLGLADQPEACGVQWSVVAFKDSRGDWLNTWFTLQPGKTFTLKTFELRDCATANCPPRPIGGPLPTPGPATTVTTAPGVSPTTMVASTSPPTPVPATPTPPPPTATTAIPDTPVPPADQQATAQPGAVSIIKPPDTGSAGLVP